MKFLRHQYIDLMSFGDFERPMFSELFGPLIGLPEELEVQGASQQEIDMAVSYSWTAFNIYAIMGQEKK